MLNFAAILDVESDRAMNLRATQPHADDRPPAPSMKFTYASGARPLAGYVIKRGIGRGGFGEVYYAASDAGKEVALKLIRRNLDIELRGVTHCLNLKHPNLLGLFDIRKDDMDDTWVVMEYINGESLEDCLGRHPNGLPVEEALTWFRGIAAGVAYLHDHGIVHRDLKPGNIFNDEGVVKIGDYGLSKFISASRRSGQTESVGTVHYMAPEIGQGRYGKEIDIYALGIVLYEVLTGHVPFDGESVGEVLMKHLTKEPDLSRVSEPFKSAIARTLAKDPEQRVQSISELMAMLPSAPGGNGWHAVRPLAATIPHVAPHAASPGMPPVGELPYRAKPDEWTTAPGGLFDEPVARKIAEWGRMGAAEWDKFKAPTLVKWLLIAVVCVAASLAWPVFAIGAPLAVTSYGFYRLIRSMVLNEAAQAATTASAAPIAAVAPAPPVARPPTPKPAYQPRPAPDPPAPLAPAPARGSTNWQRQRRLRQTTRSGPQLPTRTPQEKLSDWIVSLLVSAVAGTAIAFIILMFRGTPIEADPRPLVWLSMVISAGSWLVLTPSKWWEGRDGDPSYRRFIQLLCGLGLGAGAWALGQYLDFPLPQEWIADLPKQQHGFFKSQPRMYDLAQPIVYMANFGLLFALVRWWRQADPLRPSRISIWKIVKTGVAAVIVMALWPYPQAWGLYVACGISAAVQIAAPFHFVPRSVYADD